MTFVSRTQFHVERPWGQRLFSIVSNSVLNVKALVGAFNQEKALIDRGLLRDCTTGCGTDGALHSTSVQPTPATSSLCEITRCTQHLFLPIFWFVSRELSSLVSEWKSGTMSPGRCKYNTKERQRQLSKDWIQIIQWRLFLCQNHGWELFPQLLIHRIFWAEVLRSNTSYD